MVHCATSSDIICSGWLLFSSERLKLRYKVNCLILLRLKLLKAYFFYFVHLWSQLINLIQYILLTLSFLHWYKIDCFAIVSNYNRFLLPISFRRTFNQGIILIKCILRQSEHRLMMPMISTFKIFQLFTLFKLNVLILIQYSFWF